MANGEPNAVTDVRFSPMVSKGQGPGTTFMACGSRDGNIVVYSVEQDASKTLTGGSRITIRKQRVLAGNSSGVLNMQMSVDGTEICCNSKDGKVLAWDLLSGERKPPADSFWCRDNHKFQLTMAWQTLGIWNSDTYDASDSLVAESDHDCKVLAVGDIHGVVKLHRFPVPITHAQSRDYRGHCSRVTNICWTSDNDREQLLTVGAGRADCVIQWRLTGTTAARLSPGRQWWAASAGGGGAAGGGAGLSREDGDTVGVDYAELRGEDGEFFQLGRGPLAAVASELLAAEKKRKQEVPPAWAGDIPGDPAAASQDSSRPPGDDLQSSQSTEASRLLPAVYSPPSARTSMHSSTQTATQPGVPTATQTAPVPGATILKSDRVSSPTVRRSVPVVAAPPAAAAAQVQRVSPVSTSTTIASPSAAAPGGAGGVGGDGGRARSPDAAADGDPWQKSHRDLRAPDGKVQDDLQSTQSTDASRLMRAIYSPPSARTSMRTAAPAAPQQGAVTVPASTYAAPITSGATAPAAVNRVPSPTPRRSVPVVTAPPVAAAPVTAAPVTVTAQPFRASSPVAPVIAPTAVTVAPAAPAAAVACPADARARSPERAPSPTPWRAASPPVVAAAPLALPTAVQIVSPAIPAASGSLALPPACGSTAASASLPVGGGSCLVDRGGRARSPDAAAASDPVAAATDTEFWQRPRRESRLSDARKPSASPAPSGHSGALPFSTTQLGLTSQSPPTPTQSTRAVPVPTAGGPRGMENLMIREPVVTNGAGTGGSNSKMNSSRRSSTPGGTLQSAPPSRAEQRPVASSLSLPILPPMSDAGSVSVSARGQTRSARTPSPPRTRCTQDISALIQACPAAIQNSFKVRVLDAQTGKLLSHAVAYLYAPPFGLTGLVDFVKAAPEGEPAELFTPPQGWGVVRSRSGLVLWLNMILDRAQEAEFMRIAGEAWRTLRFEFVTSQGHVSRVSATIVGHFSSRAPLLPDEGLLHPSSSQRLRVRFMIGFDHELKMWLSHHLYSSGRGTSTQ